MNLHLQVNLQDRGKLKDVLKNNELRDCTQIQVNSRLDQSSSYQKRPVSGWRMQYLPERYGLNYQAGTINKSCISHLSGNLLPRCLKQTEICASCKCHGYLLALFCSCDIPLLFTQPRLFSAIEPLWAKRGGG